MVDFTRVKILDMVVHRVGNKFKNDGIVISKENITNPSGRLQEVLLKFFLSSFKTEQYFKFSKATNLRLNEIYNYATKIFSDNDSLYENSVNILKHLYESSVHPNIKSGELYVVLFSNCYINDEFTDAIGIFKSENKDIYLKVIQQDDSFIMDFEKGINTNKLDKGCIIFNTEYETGYKVALVDNSSKSEAMFWKKQFLSLTDYRDENFHTANYINICNRFSQEISNNLESKNKFDKIILQNNILKYFTKNKEFDLNTFTNAVIRKPEYIEKFIKVKMAYEKENEIETTDRFGISPSVLKKTIKKFRNHIKLDTNVEIKINQVEEKELQYIEKGFLMNPKSPDI
ncbi:MAG: nucleoid-associated protein [Thermoactinomyces sp.]